MDDEENYLLHRPDLVRLKSSTRNEILDKFHKQREEFRATHRELFDEAISIFGRHDPMGYRHHPNGIEEYDDEVCTILARMEREASSAHDTHRIVFEEFLAWYGLPTAGREEKYEPIAADLWAAYQRHRLSKARIE